MFRRIFWIRIAHWLVIGLPASLYLGVKRLDLYILSLLAQRNTERLTVLAGCVGTPFRQASGLFSGVRWVIVPGYGYGIFEGERDPICWEAPICISILLAGEQVFGLGVEIRGKVLSVRQLQGVKGKMYPNNLQKWPQMLVRGCVEFAELQGLREVRVHKADQGLFYTEPVLEANTREDWQRQATELRRRMRRRYDGTARQLGFKEKKKYWAWVNPHYPHPYARPE